MLRSYKSKDGIQFHDVREKDWFHDAVVNAARNKWMTGTSRKSFSPYRDTTRGMITTVLWRMEQKPESASKNPFRDVRDGSWYCEGISWAKENNIVSGYGDGNYGPEDSITREQLSSILYRYAKFKGYDVSQRMSLDSFRDNKKVSAYATETMKWAASTGLIIGKNNSKLDSRGYVTRAEFAAVLERFANM